MLITFQCVPFVLDIQAYSIRVWLYNVFVEMAGLIPNVRTTNISTLTRSNAVSQMRQIIFEREGGLLQGARRPAVSQKNSIVRKLSNCCWPWAF